MTATVPISHLPALSLPQEAYLSDECLAEEMQRIFVPGWRFVGVVSEWGNAGSYKRVQVARHDVVVVRDGQGVLHGVRNSCRHRGSSLVQGETGDCGRAISCRYHGWTFAYDGELKAAPRMGEHFDKSAFGLGTVPVEVWNGLVFVNLGGKPASSVDGALASVELPYPGLSTSKVAKRIQRVLKANWKVTWENSLECYHCSINHPTLGTVADLNADGGYFDDTVPDEDFNYYSFPILPGNVTVTPTGQLGSTKPFGSPADEPVKFLSWHASLFEMVFSPDHVAIMTHLPLSPTETLIENVFLVPGDAVAGVDFDAETFFDAHLQVRSEDDGVCERVQQGISAVGYQPGPFNDYFEMENRRFLHWYNKAMSH